MIEAVLIRGRMATDKSNHSFSGHVELLQLFMSRRAEIVEKIEGLLNAQRKPVQYLQDRSLLSRHFEDCFFTLAGVTLDQSRLRGQLEKAHWSSGFKPRQSPGLHNDLVDPAEMMIRGFGLWQQTHWPGRSGRERYAHTLFNLYVIRQLALLIMRLWDAGSSGAPDRLSQVQAALDQLWRSAPVGQPALVRDARWLIPVAQSPTTDELAGYFEVAERVARSLPDEDRIEIHKASVRMAGGHLRSQLRHVSVQKGVSLSEQSLVLSTRKSNALDVALLIQGLAPLLEAYEHAVQSGDGRKRLELADAICQGISPDPELFVNRLDLLGPYSMIEYLFITTDGEGNGVYTPMGQRHVHLFREYEARMRRLSKSLYDDCRHFRPVDGAYSPYGALYGFSSNLFEHMALRTLQPGAVTDFSLEDVFAGGEAGKRSWVNGWRQLPHIKREVAKLFEYPQLFAEEIFTRIEHALGSPRPTYQTGCLFFSSGDDSQAVPDLPAQFIFKTDSVDQADLLHSRLEGEFLVSYQTSDGWVAISKDVLTEVVGAGHDAKIVGLPSAASQVLLLMRPGGQPPEAVPHSFRP